MIPVQNEVDGLNVDYIKCVYNTILVNKRDAAFMDYISAGINFKKIMPVPEDMLERIPMFDISIAIYRTLVLHEEDEALGNIKNSYRIGAKMSNKEYALHLLSNNNTRLSIESVSNAYALFLKYGKCRNKQEWCIANWGNLNNIAPCTITLSEAALLVKFNTLENCTPAMNELSLKFPNLELKHRWDYIYTPSYTYKRKPDRARGIVEKITRAFSSMSWVIKFYCAKLYKKEL